SFVNQSVRPNHLTADRAKNGSVCQKCAKSRSATVDEKARIKPHRYTSLLVWRPTVATIENRSRFIVEVRGRADLARQFPFRRLAQATAYRDELLAAGLKPKLDQLDEHWFVRIRQRGYPTQQSTFGSRKEADAFVLKVEEERNRGLFTDYTKAHKTSLAELLVRY